MAGVNWGLANPGGGFDYLDSLRQIGNLALQRQQQQAGDYRMAQAQRIDQSRAQTAGMARAGDFAGARQEAALAGDFDMAQAFGGLRDDQLAQAQRELDTIGTLHPVLKGMPVEQRAAVAIPALKQAGFSDEELAGVDWSDGGIDAVYQLSAAGKAALKARMDAAAELNKPYTLNPGDQRRVGATVIAENPYQKPIWDSESGSLIYPDQFSPRTTQPGTGQGTGDVFQRMISVESGGRQFAAGGGVLTSPKGAVGIAQVMPGTAPEAARLAGLPWSAERYRSDPEYNRQLGEAYFNKQLATFGDERKAAAAYNAGPGRVQEAMRKGGVAWERHLPPETTDYLNKVFRGQGDPGTPGVINVRPPKSRDDYRLLSPQEAAAQGLDPATRYQISGKGQITPVGGQSKANDGRKAEADLRKQFDALPEVKNFKTARQQYYALRDIALNPSATASDDIAVIFSFMRTLDPTSTVREGEFATAQNAAGVPERLRNYYNQIARGNRLNAGQRRDMVATAFKSYARFREAYNTSAEMYRGYAKDYGVSPDRVARTYTPDKAKGVARTAPLARGQSRRVGNITIRALN